MLVLYASDRWSDALLAAERGHLERLLMWGALSLVAGTALAVWRARSRRAGEFVKHFALQTALWGIIDVLITVASWRSLAPRELASAVRLDRFLWLNVGLDVGYLLVGLTLAITGWRLERRMGMVGAGTAIVLQGAALFALDLVLIERIGRIV